MAGTEYYDSSGTPAHGAQGSSQNMRAEFNAVEAGFDKLPSLSGNGNKAVIINAGGSAMTLTTGTLALAGNFSTLGANSLALTTTGATALTLPTSGTLATQANKLSVFAATTSAELAGVISDETGSGALVFATSPTLVTPTLGVATATSVNKVALTAPATGSTLTIADGKTLTVSNTLTFTGTDASSVALGTGGTVAYTANKLSAFSATTSAELAGVISDETGSGALVFATSPTLTTPNIGAATGSSLNVSTGVVTASNTAKAWVNFNGTGVVAIRADHNVDSITDNGTGDYTVNFTDALADANYAVNFTGSVAGVTSIVLSRYVNTATAQTTSLVRVGATNGSAGNATDDPNLFVSIFR